MPERDIYQEIRLKKIDEINIYLIEEINHNNLTSKTHKKFVLILTIYLL